MPISQGSVTLPAAGSQPSRLTNGSIVASRSVVIVAPSGNAGTVYIGPSGVTTSTGLPLAAGDNISLDGGGLEDIYVRGTEADTLRWMAVG